VLRTFGPALAACVPVGVFAGGGRSGGVDFYGAEPAALLYISTSGALHVRPATRLADLARATCTILYVTL